MLPCVFIAYLNRLVSRQHMVIRGWLLEIYLDTLIFVQAYEANGDIWTLHLHIHLNFPQEYAAVHTNSAWRHSCQLFINRTSLFYIDIIDGKLLKHHKFKFLTKVNSLRAVRGVMGEEVGVGGRHGRLEEFTHM